MTAHPGVGTARRRGWDAAAVAGCVVLAVALAPLGTTVLYLLVGLVVAGVLLRGVRAEVVPPLRAAAARLRPRPAAGRRPTTGAAAVTGAGIAAVAVAVVTVPLAAHALVVLGVLAGGLVLAAACWLCRPLLEDLVARAPEDVPARPRSAGRRPGPAWSSRHWAVVLTAAAVSAALLALVLGGLGGKVLLAIACVVLLGVLAVAVRDPSVCFTFLAVASFALVLHKSLGPQDLEQSGGAISVYVSTFDAMLLLLYAFWIREGTIVADARAAVRRPVIWLPLAGALLLLPSLLVAPSTWHAASELFRMAWMYALYFYVAVRVRTRRHVWAVLGGLAVFAVVEFVVVLGQWATGGNLGLSFLGVPADLTQRISDTGSIGRPFGTIVHPVFMGAVMGSLSLLALSLAIHLRRSLTKVVAAALVAVCTIPLWLSHTRASFLAFVLTAAYVLATGLRRRRLAYTTLGRFALAGLAGVVVLWPQLQGKFSENFFTGHFWEEIQSRLQLNGIAMDMFDDHWLLGVGLNNFEVVLPRYEPHFVIFFGNPVHNLYLLYLSETGVIGFAGFALVAVAVLVAAVRAARSDDRLLGGTSIGIVAAMVFLGLEELLGFSLRQDVPLALCWLLAGLAVACARTGRTTRPEATGPAGPERRPVVPEPRPPVPPDHRAPRPDGAGGALGRRARWLARRLAGARPRRLPVIAAVVVGAGAVLVPAHGLAGEPGTPGIVFEATVRATGRQAIFTAKPDGTGIRQISPRDGLDHRWPRWAFGNRKIVYTTTAPVPGSPTQIELMNRDGSGIQGIATFGFPVIQPLIDPSGTWMLFTASAPWFPGIAVFKMDLQTLQSVNLSAVTIPWAGQDSDPTIAPDQRSLAMISGNQERADVTGMAVDGSGRRAFTHDRSWNTDPSFSPDGTQIVVSSYRGTAPPGQVDAGARPHDFHVVVHDLRSGTERVLTQGVACAERLPGAPCSVPQMSGYVPRFTDDGSTIDFVGAIDRRTTCICAIGVDGGNPHSVVIATELGIVWFDLARAGANSGWQDIGSRRPAAHLLVTMASVDGSSASLVDASPDLMHRTLLRLPAGLTPVQARWRPDRSRIAFTARVPVAAHPAAAHPAPPAGQSRREHVTLSELDPVTLAQQGARPTSDAELQVFLREPDGTVRQLTDPWIEDWRDGVRGGDARASTDPIFTPDGRAVIVTNTSTLTGESFLLRIDLTTGAVLNLTNATSGAVPVQDRMAAVSPDGRAVAFSWVEGADAQLCTMDAEGFSVRRVTADPAAQSQPAWLPDASAIVSVGDAPGGPVLERTAVRDGTRIRLTTPADAANRPVVDGHRVLYLGRSPTAVNLFAVPAGGGTSAPVQPDPLHQYLDLDQR